LTPEGLDARTTKTSSAPALGTGVSTAPARRRSIVSGTTSRRLGQRLLSLFSPILLLLLWEALVRIGVLDRRFFPAPTSIMGTFGDLVTSGLLLTHLKDTLGRISIGLLMGSIPGLILGVAMGLSPWVRALLKPMVAALFPIPKIAILPLIMLIFGLGEMSKYVSIAIGIVFLVLINTMAGVMNIEKIYLDVGRNYGADRWQVFRTIAIPGAMPAIFTGIQLAMGVALIVVVATEFVGANTGIGYLIWSSWQTFAIEKMYCGLVVTSFLGFVAQLLLDALQRVLIPWKPELH
jgi:NitT/TauT family transport system permease protein